MAESMLPPLECRGYDLQHNPVFVEFPMQKTTIIDQLVKAVSAACAPIGIKKTDIVPSPRGLSIPSCGIVLTLQLPEDGEKVRVWSAVEHFTITNFGSDDEKKAVRGLFEVPLGGEWRVAKMLATILAERRINAAIDAATA